MNGWYNTFQRARDKQQSTQLKLGEVSPNYSPLLQRNGRVDRRRRRLFELGAAPPAPPGVQTSRPDSGARATACQRGPRGRQNSTPRAPSRGLRESFNPPLAIMALDKNRSRPMLLIAPPQGIPRESALLFLRLASTGPYDAADTRDDGRGRPFHGGPGRATRDDRGDQGGTTIGTSGGGDRHE